MVHRVAPPEFLDPRPGINKYRFWPLGIAAAGMGTVLAAGVWWVTSGDGQQLNKARNDPQMIAAAKPLVGLPTDYTQIKRPPPPPPPPPQPEPPAPDPDPKPVQVPSPEPAVRHQGGQSKKSWQQEAREAQSKLIQVTTPNSVSGDASAGEASSGGNVSGGKGQQQASGRSSIYSTARLSAAYPHQVNAGTPIRAHTEQPITTAAPGYITAMTIGDIYTSDKKCVAIPHGSRLFGETIGEVKEGQVKVTTVWTALTRPPPKQDTIELTKVVGADADGTPGISGSVNNHWFRKFGFIIASSAIDLGVAALSGHGSGGPNVIIGGTVAENARSPLDEFAKRQLDIPPTIEVDPREISVMLNQHLPMDCFK